MCDPVSAILIGGAIGLGGKAVRNAAQAQRAQVSAQQDIVVQNTKNTKNQARLASQETIAARSASYDTRRRVGSGSSAKSGISGLTSSRSFFSQA